MTRFDFELVGKIGSMALIRKDDHDIDYNVFARIGRELAPGMIWVSSGAAEIGRLDYMARNGGRELLGDSEDVKTDYASQGQTILMENYRRFVPARFGVRQLLVEHSHFNNPEKREHIRRFLMRSAVQASIPIVNYNDPVSFKENLRWEMRVLKERDEHAEIVECIDNDETAAVITTLVRARFLIILTSALGIYTDVNDPSTLVEEIGGKDADEVIAGIHHYQNFCKGASRKGANGAKAKLEFCIKPVEQGTTVFIASAQYSLRDILSGKCRCTRIGVR